MFLSTAIQILRKVIAIYETNNTKPMLLYASQRRAYNTKELVRIILTEMTIYPTRIVRPSRHRRKWTRRESIPNARKRTVDANRY